MELIVVDGPDRGRRLALGVSARSIGRDDDNDLALADATVSGRHAIVRVVDGQRLELTDLASTNGTWVDGQRITGAVLVGADQAVTVGTTELVLDAGRADGDPVGDPVGDPIGDPVWATGSSAPPQTDAAGSSIPSVSHAGPVAGGDISMSGHAVAGRDLTYHEGFRIRSRMRPPAKRLLRIGVGFVAVGALAAAGAVIGLILSLSRPAAEVFDTDGFSDDFLSTQFIGLVVFGAGMLMELIGLIVIVVSLLMRREKIPEPVPIGTTARR